MENILIHLFLSAENPELEDFNPLIFIGLIIVLLAIFISIIIIAITVIGVLALLAIGTFSGSLLIGINKRSFTTGFKTFAIVFSTLSCTFLGGITIWLLNNFTEWWTAKVAMIIGGSIGLFGGVGLGLSISYLIKILSTYFKKQIAKYNSKKSGIS